MQPANQAKIEPQPHKQERARISKLETQTVKTLRILVPQKTEALKLGQLTMKQGIKGIDVESSMAQTSF